jgi:formylglycine-generating enzyme required for sulfatase activity
MSEMTNFTPIFDRAGFPLIWVPVINAYIHWLPVTKIQFEEFISDLASPQYDERMYNEVLKLNPRISPKNARVNNYWQLFLSGIKPEEARSYAKWCGPEYRLPTQEQWNQCYAYLNAQPAEFEPFEEKDLKAETWKVVRCLEEVRTSPSFAQGGGQTLAQQMFMRFGVMEWVVTTNQGWGGLGQSPTGLMSISISLEKGRPIQPSEPGATRLKNFGFRLICNRREA